MQNGGAVQFDWQTQTASGDTNISNLKPANESKTPAIKFCAWTGTARCWRLAAANIISPANERSIFISLFVTLVATGCATAPIIIPS